MSSVSESSSYSTPPLAATEQLEALETQQEVRELHQQSLLEERRISSFPGFRDTFSPITSPIAREMQQIEHLLRIMSELAAEEQANSQHSSGQPSEQGPSGGSGTSSGTGSVTFPPYNTAPIGGQPIEFPRYGGVPIEHSPIGIGDFPPYGGCPIEGPPFGGYKIGGPIDLPLPSPEPYHGGLVDLNTIGGQDGEDLG